MNKTINSSLQMLACNYISGQLDKLMKHLQGAGTAEDPEDVHQVRVACRRMRMAMCLFSDCIDEKAVAEWQKQLKKLLKDFGAARDLDVQIAFLGKTLKALPVEQKKMRPGIRRMLLRRKQQRDAAQARVIKSINRIRKKQVLTCIHLQMQKCLFLLKPQNLSIQRPVVYQRAYEHIRYQLGQLLDQRPAMDDPMNAAGHHSVRIAAKKLRYTMEIYNESMEHRLEPAIKTVKKMQTLLGDIHDCDVWDGDIEQFIEQERQRTVDFYGNAGPFSRILPGLEYLQSERKNHRLELFTQAREFIGQLDREAFWQKLLDMLQSTFIRKGNSREDQPDRQAESIPASEDRDPV